MPETITDFDPDFAAPLEWAAMYRRCGLQIVPAKSPIKGGEWKMPALAKWKEWRRTFVPDAVFNGWFGESGEYRTHDNMGVICGDVSNRVVMIDLDTYKSGAALTWWLGVLAEHNNNMEPETWEQITGGGGRQLFFRYPVGWKAVNASTNLNVDIRGNGGFAMLPPSQHTSGRRYDWVSGRGPHDIPIATAQPWLLDEIDRLIREHGGLTHAGVVDHGPDDAPEFTAFARRTNRREQYMRDLIWAAMTGFRLQSPIPVGAKEQEAIWADYERNCGPKTIIDGESNADGLEREGRGHTLFEQKWTIAVEQWDTEVNAAAKERAEKEKAEAEPKASEPPPEQPKTPPTPIKVRSAFPIDRMLIPPRDWAVPGLLLKRNVTMLVAPPGSGKSLLSLQWAIMEGVGIQWAGWTPRKAEKTFVVNAEDDFDEMQRRLVVAAEQMGVSQADLEDRVILAEEPENIVISRHDARSRSIVRTPLVEDLVLTIKQLGIGVVIVDPFAETFEGDENNNSEVKWAGVLWREVARRTGVSLVLVHHTRKYAGDMAGNADASRGGGSMIGIARILVTLFDMTEDEALAMGVPVENRTDYVRFDDAKANHNKKGVVRWFEKRSVDLGNGNGFIPSDDVGVLVSWKPPGLMDGIAMPTLTMVWDTIDRGILDINGKPTGSFFTISATSANKDRWAGTVVTKLLGCSEEKAKSILKEWIEKGVLETFEYNDAVQRKQRTGVRSTLQNRPDHDIKTYS